MPLTRIRGWLALALTLWLVTLTDALAQFPMLIRNYTPEKWQARVVQWNRDVNPRNKLDDTIDRSNKRLYEVIINYNRCLDDADIEFLEGLSPESHVQLRSKYISSVFVAGLTQDDLRRLADRPEVAFIEEQHEMRLHLATSLPSMCVTPGPCSPNTVQEAFPAINGSGVNIAIIDSGVDNGTHDTFTGVTFVGGYNAVTSTFEDPDDMLFHGTHVASIALGRGGASAARGVANGASLIDVKVTDTPTFPPTRVCQALEVVYDNRSTWNVGVVNMSLGSSVSSDGTDALSQLVDLAESMGIVVVVSAGNNGPGNVGLGAPACATRAITVAAQETQNTTGRGDDLIACFSSRGPRANDGDADQIDELKPDVAAPGTHLDASVPTCQPGFGTGILAARWNTASGTIRLEGTSMASPHVAGLAALILQARPGINPASVKDLIISTATPLGPASMPAVDPVWNNQSGFGLVNAFQALNLATVTDLSYPSYPPSPGWLSPDITTAPFPPKVGVPTTVTVMVTNRGPAAATAARINFGVHVFSAATPTFYDIGTRIVNIPPNTTLPVSINWTPQNASHQCLKVQIGYGPDTDYSNNNAQRNLNVQSSPANFMVQNTLTEEPAEVRLVPTMDNPQLNWDFALKPRVLTLGAMDCPQQVSVELFPPGDAPPGQRQRIHVAAVMDTPFGPVTLGGISVDGIANEADSCLWFECPDNIVAQTTDPAGTKVEFDVPLIDQCNSKDLQVTCVPPSGSLFPLGKTAVTCTAVNEQGVEARCTFTVEVIQPRVFIRPVGKRLEISWIGEGILQEADEATGPWRDVPNATNPMFVVPNAAMKFYRLRLAPEPPAKLPTFSVTGPSMLPKQFAVLSEMLGLPGDAYQKEGGYVDFIDPDLFQWIPTKVIGEGGDADKGEETPVREAILFDELRQMPVLEPEVAMEMAIGSLAQADLLPGGLYQGEPFPAHSMFQAVDVLGKNVVSQEIDTQVGFHLSLGEVPLVGPGAKLKLSFDNRRRVTQMAYALRQVEEGRAVEALPQEVADEVVMERYRGLLGEGATDLQLNSRLVYYAPPVDMAGVQTILPHYEYGGSYIPRGAKEPVQLRRLLLPAVQSVALVPTADMQIDPAGRRIFANAIVEGGLKPYSYQWNSSTTVLDPDEAAQPKINYTVSPGKESPLTEVLTLIVTDANGIMATASQSVKIAAGLASPVGPAVGGVKDIGTEWIGTSQGLSGSAGNAGGFVSRFLIDNILFGGTTDIRFNWGDYSAWEQDFKDNVLGGDDFDWIDNVDAAFYTGHANGSGWTFPGNHDDGFLHYSEARYGNHDLEWLVVAACGPLQLGSSPNRWYQRWGPAFRGLHLLCGYQTITADNTAEGRKWASYMLSGWTVRQAWMKTGKEVQNSSRIVAVMGVFGPDGVSNWNDHYHGKGSVGPDITDIRGYWMVYAPCD